MHHDSATPLEKQADNPGERPSWFQRSAGRVPQPPSFLPPSLTILKEVFSISEVKKLQQQNGIFFHFASWLRKHVLIKNIGKSLEECGSHLLKYFWPTRKTEDMAAVLLA